MNLPSRGMLPRALAGVSLAAAVAACQSAGTTPQPSVESSSQPSAAQSTAASMPASAAPSVAGDVAVATSQDVGEHLVDAEGRTLYVFTNDMPGMSHCFDGCAANWPPYLVDGGPLTAGEGITAELGTLDRGDGTLQATLDGWPLYYYAADQAAGDTTGEGVGGVWFVARPDASLPSASSSASPSEGADSSYDPYDY
jgi:predicted lipoprotein with Yx(FWY)xxD motif